MSRYIKLPNALVFNADDLLVIARQDLNDYVLVLKNCPMPLKLDAKDVGALEAYLQVTSVEEPKQIVH